MGALLVVRENLVGFGDLLKALGRLGIVQVWSLTQFYSVDFLQSGSIFNISVFNKHIITLVL